MKEYSDVFGQHQIISEKTIDNQNNSLCVSSLSIKHVKSNIKINILWFLNHRVRLSGNNRCLASSLFLCKYKKKLLSKSRPEDFLLLLFSLWPSTQCQFYQSSKKLGMLGEFNWIYSLALKLLKYVPQILFCQSQINKINTAFACTLGYHPHLLKIDHITWYATHDYKLEHASMMRIRKLHSFLLRLCAGLASYWHKGVSQAGFSKWWIGERVGSSAFGMIQDGLEASI